MVSLSGRPRNSRKTSPAASRTTPRATRVGHARIALRDHGPRRDMQKQCLALGSRATPALAGTAARRDKAPLVAKRRQGGVRRVRDDDNVTSPASVAPVRSPGRNVFLPPETRRSTTAGPCDHVDVDLVEERRAACYPAASARSATATSSTSSPIRNTGIARTLARVRSWPEWSYATVPVRSANSV